MGFIIGFLLGVGVSYGLRYQDQLKAEFTKNFKWFS